MDGRVWPKQDKLEARLMVDLMLQVCVVPHQLQTYNCTTKLHNLVQNVKAIASVRSVHICWHACRTGTECKALITALFCDCSVMSYDTEPC